jgi:hypothetical protein
MTFQVAASKESELAGSLVLSDGDIHAPNRADRHQPRTHRAGLDMSQLSTRLRERRGARLFEEVLSKPVGSGTRASGHPAGLPATWSKRADRVLLVWPLQGLALDLEVDEPNSAVAPEETDFQMSGIRLAAE